MGFSSRHFVLGLVSLKRWAPMLRIQSPSRASMFGAMLAALVIAKAITISSRSANAQDTHGKITGSQPLEKCEFSDQIGNMLVASQNRAGEYRIKLHIDNRSNKEVVRHHLINATVFARLLMTK